MTKIYKRILTLSLTAFVGALCLNYSSGPGLNNQSVTGAPFGSGTCSNCHSGGSFSANASVQLYLGATQVTGNIVPGWAYTVRVTRSAVGVPGAGGWGFQMTCVNNASNANINAWGTPPAGTANRLLSSRNYLEHTGKISNSTTQVNIPWTAPSIGPGSVIKFYLAVNTVNGNSNTGGDQVVATTAQFTQAPLPLTWLYFRGKESGTANLLEWAVSNEVNNDFYTVERSENGIDFKEVGSVKADHDPVAIHVYSLADAEPFTKTYYRISQTDLNGQTSYFNTIQIVRPEGVKSSHSLTPNAVVVRINTDHERDVNASIYTMDGRLVASKDVMLKIGENVLSFDRPASLGMYLISVRDARKEIYRAKFYQ